MSKTTSSSKAELRLRELYGRRRRGIQDGQERPKLPEGLEIEELSRQLKEVLEHHLARLGPPGESAQRARWRERVSGIGSPVEARTLHRQLVDQLRRSRFTTNNHLDRHP